MRVLNGRTRLVAALLGLAAVAGAVAFAWARRGPGAEPDAIRRWWTERGGGPPNVLVVTLDTTRADRLGCYGAPDVKTPNLDLLARRGALFEEASTVAPLTQPAHSSLMTGTYPAYHGVRVNGSTALGAVHRTLAEVFREQGYRTGAFLGAFVLDGRWGLNQGFETYDDRFDLQKYKHLDLGSVQRPGNAVMDSALRWLEAHKQERFFAWIHLYDAHTPYEPPEPFLSAYRSRGLEGLYDGEIAFADQQVGRALGWLDANGLAKRTVVVVLGDHGESLGHHGEGTHGYFVYEDTLRIPLLIATPMPGPAGARVASPVSIVDVFPTVLGLAGLDPGPRVQGRSLVRAMLRPRASRESYAFGESMTPNLQYGWSPLYSLRSSRYKLVQAPRPELFDLAADPDEKTDVIARHAREAEDLRRRLDRLLEETGRGAPAPETADLDKQTMEGLAALGYVGGPAAPAASSGPLADPKDKLAVFTSVQLAGELIMKDDYAGAAAALEKALGEEPRMIQARLMLGTAYSELGRKAEAKAQFDGLLKDDPQSVQALIGMANVLKEEGRGDDVIALCKRTLSLDERNTQAYTLLGEVYVDRERPAEAIPWFEKAVAIQPKLTQNRLNLAAALIEVGQRDRAESLLEEILRDYPKFPLARFNLGLLYEGEGRVEEGRAAYAAEVETYPQQFKARFNLGKLLFALGDQAGSLEQMREVVRLAPDRPEGHLFLARGLLAGGAPLDGVQAEVEKGLSLARTPDTRTLGWLLLADVFNRRKQPGKMAEALRMARAATPAARTESRHARQSH